MRVDAHNALPEWDSAAPAPLCVDALVDRLRRGGIKAVGLVLSGDRAFPSTDVFSAWEGTQRALAENTWVFARCPERFPMIYSCRDLRAPRIST